MFQKPRRLCLLISCFAAMFGCSDPEITTVEKADLVLVGGTVLDGTGADPKLRRAVFIRDGKISEIAPVQQIDYSSLASSVVNVEGKFLIPGIVDSHTHIDHVNGINLTEEEKEIARNYNLRAFLYNGVTTVLNMSTRHPEWLLDVKNKADSGQYASPRIFTGANHFTQPGGWGGRHGGGLESIEDIAPRLRDYRQQGFDLVKIIYEDGLGHEPVFTRLPVDEVRVVAQEAKKLDMPLFIHATDHNEYEEAIASAPNAIAHGMVDIAEADQQVVSGLVENNIAVVPTMVLFESFYRYVDKPKLLQDPYLKNSVPDFVMAAVSDSESIENALQKVDAILRMDSVVWGRQAMTNLYSTTQQFSDAGVTLAIGSDSGGAVLHAFQGYNTIREMELLAQCCLSNADVLKAATFNAAKIMGREDEFGSLRIGRSADILVLNADPMADIASVRNFDFLVLRGTPWQRDQFAYKNYTQAVAE